MWFPSTPSPHAPAVKIGLIIVHRCSGTGEVEHGKRMLQEARESLSDGGGRGMRLSKAVGQGSMQTQRNP